MGWWQVHRNRRAARYRQAQHGVDEAAVLLEHAHKDRVANGWAGFYDNTPGDWRHCARRAADWFNYCFRTAQVPLGAGYWIHTVDGNNIEGYTMPDNRVFKRVGTAYQQVP